jgi:hypothetical protein
MKSLVYRGVKIGDRFFTGFLWELWIMWIIWWIKMDILQRGAFSQQKMALKAILCWKLCTFFGDKAVNKWNLNVKNFFCKFDKSSNIGTSAGSIC